MIHKRFGLILAILCATLVLVGCSGISQEQVQEAVEQTVPTLETAATILAPTIEAAAEELAPTAEPTATQPPPTIEPTVTETIPTAEVTATKTPPTAEPTPTIASEPCAPSTTGELADIDPRGQTIQWWHNYSGFREEQLLALVTEFNETNECAMTVELSNEGSYRDIREQIDAHISAGEPPAVLVVGFQNDQALYQLTGSLVDLNPYVNDPHWGLTAEEQADFFPAIFEQSLHPSFGNQRLGFPPTRALEVLFYNQTWLEELGFAGPPETPEAFREMACAAAEANDDGTGGYVLRDDASAFASWTYAFGGDLLTEDRTSYVYNSPATAEAMTFLKSLYDEGCAYFYSENFPDPELAARHAIFTQGSSSGLPFYQSGIETVAEETGREPDIWGVAAIPHTTPDPVINVYGGDMMITANSPEQQLAGWVFIKWFTSSEIQGRWDEISIFFPTRASAEEFLSDFIAESEFGTQYQQALDLLPFGTYEPPLASYTAVRGLTQEAFNSIMQGADVQTILDQLTEEANELEVELMSEVP